MRARATSLAAPCVLACVLAWPLGAQQPAPAIDSIRQSDLRADLFFLASDQMRGRLTGTAENRLAAEWIKARFERLGLSPGVQGYFQTYDLATVSLGRDNAMTITRPGTARRQVEHGDGVIAERFSPTARASGRVVFAGYGITAEDLGHDDYRARDLFGGAIVLVVDHEPGERDPASRFDGVITSDAAGPLKKALAAQAAGAAGILFAPDVHNHPAAAGQRGGRGGRGGGAWPTGPSRLGRYTLSDWMRQLRIPAARLTADLAEELVAGSGRTFAALSESADTPGGVPAIALDEVTIDLSIAVDRQDLKDRNVLAVLEGSDPVLRDEWVVLTAHYDHDGATDTAIYNGADDDGSGTVG
ncbi:MAG TPA: M28 family peptidase, partial [Vicinamibacterales bacterium]|nr:M28 family peptidase [Vicinamibacterales bacterium]